MLEPNSPAPDFTLLDRRRLRGLRQLDREVPGRKVLLLGRPALQLRHRRLGHDRPRDPEGIAKTHDDEVLQALAELRAAA